jgi:spore cortex formation protein SpoVR/YcgB (stage V sporulation)
VFLFEKGGAVIWLLKFLSVAGLAFATDILSSGRDEDVFAKNMEASKLIDAVCDRLGLKRPPHQVHFTPSAQLAQLASLGRPALGHWRDGSIIASQARSAMGVLEFVVPGHHSCQSFFSDSTNFHQQVEILKHVAGHNDFSVVSKFSKIRMPMNPIQKSFAMFDRIEQLLQTESFEEVTTFLQWIYTLAHAQDLVRGTWDHQPGTSNELNFTATHFSDPLKPWKRELLQGFEEMHRGSGFVTVTKVMNEGWATFLQDFLTPYLPYVSHAYMLDAAELKTGVSFKKFTNPYWIGREAWRRVLHRFLDGRERTEELDKLFIQFAHLQIEQMDDMNFLRSALDAKWVRDQRLFLHAPVPLEALNFEQRFGPHDWRQVVSLDANEILDVLVTRYFNLGRVLPQVLIRQHATHIELEHRVIEGIPLDHSSILPSLFVRAQIWQKPIKMRAYLPNWRNPKVEEMLKLIPVDFEVQPPGTFTLLVEGVEDASWNDIFGKAFSSFLEEIYDERLKESLPPATLKKVLDPLIEPAIAAVSHAPTTATALLRYHDMLAHRLIQALKKSFRAGSNGSITAEGIRLKVLPSIPEFLLDQQFIETRRHYFNNKKKIQDPSVSPWKAFPVSLEGLLQAQRLEQGAVREESGVELGADTSGVPLPGDKFPVPKPDPEADDGQPEKPGSEEVEVPFRLLGEILAEEIDLPKLRPRPGISMRRDTERGGVVSRSYGDVLWNRVIPKALVFGKMQLGSDASKRVWLKEGMKFIQPSDWMVASREPILRPDLSAVVIFWMDLTGSMSGLPLQMARHFFYHLKALLEYRYKSIDFRYIGFAEQAYEYPDSFTFFQAFLSGATYYAKGVQKSLEILTDFPSSRYDRFVFGIGDLEDFEPDKTIPLLEELISQANYSGIIHTLAGGTAHPQLLRAIQNLAATEPFFGMASLELQEESVVTVIRELFGAQREK